MSRCGSCPIYGSEKYGVFCSGNCGVEDCADKLQNLYWAINDETEKLKIFSHPNYPLTLYELRKMDGDPVWCVLNENGIITVSCWTIVSVELERCAGNTIWLNFEDYGAWLAYHRRPEKGS